MRNQLGFTLIELLVVITILGILAGFAFPQYEAMRKKSYNQEAISEIRRIIQLEETYYADNQTYTTCNSLGCEVFLPEYKVASGVRPDVGTMGAGIEEEFFVMACHQSGDKYYFWYSQDADYGELGVRKGGVILEFDREGDYAECTGTAP